MADAVMTIFAETYRSHSLPPPTFNSSMPVSYFSRKISFSILHAKIEVAVFNTIPCLPCIVDRWGAGEGGLGFNYARMRLSNSEGHWSFCGFKRVKRVRIFHSKSLNQVTHICSLHRCKLILLCHSIWVRILHIIPHSKMVKMSYNQHFSIYHKSKG